MKWTLGISAFATIIVAFVLIGNYRTKINRLAHAQFNDEFAAYISAYTSGEISRTSSILIQFADEMIGEEELEEELTDQPFQFEPRIKGKAKWENTRTLRFEPETPLPNGELFNAKLRMDDMPGDFLFQFAVEPQDIEVAIKGMHTIDEHDFKWQKLKGEVKTNSLESNEAIEKILSASLKKGKLKITWDHKKDGYLHAFEIDSIQRQDEEEEIQLAWNGEGLGLNIQGRKNVNVPPIGVFKHTRTTHFSGNSPRVELEFSDPLDPLQDLDGLIQLGSGRVNTMIEGNKITVFPTGALSGINF